MMGKAIPLQQAGEFGRKNVPIELHILRFNFCILRCSASVNDRSIQIVPVLGTLGPSHPEAGFGRLRRRQPGSGVAGTTVGKAGKPCCILACSDCVSGEGQEAWRSGAPQGG